jgi:hypothetical protein
MIGLSIKEKRNGGGQDIIVTKLICSGYEKIASIFFNCYVTWNYSTG